MSGGAKPLVCKPVEEKEAGAGLGLRGPRPDARSHCASDGAPARSGQGTWPARGRKQEPYLLTTREEFINLPYLCDH